VIATAVQAAKRGVQLAAGVEAVWRRRDVAAAVDFVETGLNLLLTQTTFS
jgi:hypothetical protein